MGFSKENRELRLKMRRRPDKSAKNNSSSRRKLNTKTRFRLIKMPEQSLERTLESMRVRRVSQQSHSEGRIARRNLMKRTSQSTFLQRSSMMSITIITSRMRRKMKDELYYKPS